MNNELEKFTCSLYLPLVDHIVVLCLSSSTVLVFAFFVFFGFLAIINDSKTNLDLSLLTFNGVCCCCSLRFASVRFDSILFCVVLFTAELGFYCGVVFGLFALPSPTPSCCTQPHTLTTTVQSRALQHGGYDDIKNPTNNGTINSYNISDNNKTNNVKSKAQSALNVVLVFQSRGQSYFS